MTMSKHITLSAMLLVALFTASCTSSTQGSLGSRAASSPGAPVATAAAPGPESLVTQPDGAPAQGQPLLPPSLAPNRCPPITANPISTNPVGCPGSLPPQPISPQTGHARILFCMQPIAAAAPPITVASVLCGAGFRPEELVTITVSGRAGSTSWKVTTARDGSFRSTVPATACQLMPAYITARGNRGSVSNAVPLTMAACGRIP
jgi:hypothetical protein